MSSLTRCRIVIFPLACLEIVERLACASAKLEGVLAWEKRWLGESNVWVSVRLVWSEGRVGIFSGVLVCELPLPRGNEGSLRSARQPEVSEHSVPKGHLVSPCPWLNALADLLGTRLRTTCRRWSWVD